MTAMAVRYPKHHHSPGMSREGMMPVSTVFSSFEAAVRLSEERRGAECGAVCF